MYLHIQASSKQTNVVFELYSNTGAVARDTVTVDIDAGETISISLHHRISSTEKLVVRIMGTNLEVTIAPESRVEVTLLRRWQPPELVISGSPYTWGSGTYTLSNDVEKYHTMHITGQKGTAFVSKTISPLWG